VKTRRRYRQRRLIGATGLRGFALDCNVWRQDVVKTPDRQMR